MPSTIRTSSPSAVRSDVRARLGYWLRQLKQPGLSNSYWLLLEQAVRLLVGLLVGIYVARHLGPSNQGIVAFFTAMAALLNVVSKQGLDAVILRACVPERNNKVAASAFFLIAAVSWAIFGSTLVYAFVSGDHALIIAATVFLPFQPFTVYDSCFQAEYKAKYGSASRSVALVVGALARIIAIREGGPLWVFVAIPALEQAAGLIVVFAVAKIKRIEFKGPAVNITDHLTVARDGLPLLVSGLAVVMYMKTDQLMIKYMLGNHHLGLYSAATKWYDAWVAVPYLLSISLFPLLLKSREKSAAVYRRQLVLIIRGVFWASACVAILFSMFSAQIIQISFGSEYIAASTILPIIMFTSCWAAVGSVTARYLVAERRYGAVLSRTVIGLTANIVANACLIPVMGLTGAALGTLACNFIAYFIFDWFDAKSAFLLDVKKEAIFGVSRGG